METTKCLKGRKTRQMREDVNTQKNIILSVKKANYKTVHKTHLVTCL